MNESFKNKKVIILVASTIILITIVIVTAVLVNKHNLDNPVETINQSEQIDENQSNPNEEVPESNDINNNPSNNSDNPTTDEDEISDEEIENALKEAMENTELKLNIEDKGDTVVATFLEDNPLLPGQVTIVYNYHFTNGTVDNVLVEYKLNDKELAQELYEELTSDETDDSFYNIAISPDGTSVTFNEDPSSYGDMSKEQLIDTLKKFNE